MSYPFSKGDRVRYTGAKGSAFASDRHLIGAEGTVYNQDHKDNVNVFWDGHPAKTRGHYPGNLELIAKALDVTKPLEFFGSNTGGASDATFITETSEGYLLIGEAKSGIVATAVGGWVMFTKTGAFVRSGNDSGTALILRNKVVERVVTKYKVQVLAGVPVFMRLDKGCLDDNLEVVTEGDTVVEMTTRG